MSIFAYIILSLFVIYLELFFASAFAPRSGGAAWPAAGIYFSLALVAALLVKQKTHPAAAVAITTGLINDLLVAHAPFGLFLAGHVIFFLAVKKLLALFRSARRY